MSDAIWKAPDGYVDYRDYQSLEAERDRLKHTAKELGDSFDRGIDREDALRIENNKLRARHAALVEVAEKVVTTTKQHIDCDCNLCQLKSALAEVKG